MPFFMFYPTIDAHILFSTFFTLTIPYLTSNNLFSPFSVFPIYSKVFALKRRPSKSSGAKCRNSETFYKLSFHSFNIKFDRALPYMGRQFRRQSNYGKNIVTNASSYLFLHFVKYPSLNRLEAYFSISLQSCKSIQLISSFSTKVCENFKSTAFLLPSEHVHRDPSFQFEYEKNSFYPSFPIFHNFPHTWFVGVILNFIQKIERGLRDPGLQNTLK